MQTVVRRRVRESATAVPVPPPAASPRRRRRRGLILAALALLVLVWFLPALVAGTGLRQLALDRAAAAAGLNGRLTVRELSLGWFSPVQISDLVLADSQGQPVIQIKQVSTERSLLGLLANLSHLGGVRLENPAVDLRLRADGSNLEDVLAGLLAQPPTADAKLPRGTFEIVAGQVSIVDEVSQRQWTVADLAVKVACEDPDSEPLAIDVAGTLGDQDGSGPVQLNCQVWPSATPWAAEGKLVVERLPLELPQAWLRRSQSQMSLAGQLATQIEFHLNAPAAPGDHRVQATLDLADVHVAGPWVGGDVLKLAQVHLPVRLGWRDDTLRIEHFDLACDAGELSCQGTIPHLSELSLSLPNLLAAAGRAQGHLDGRLDLARLAALLPQTLHLREGLTIDQGELTLALASEPEAQYQAPGARAAQPATPSGWRGRLQTGALVATHLGERLVWDEPLTIDLAARHTPGGLTLDQLRCTSSFLSLTGSGSPAEFSLQADYDLARLRAELARFVDLGDLRLTGTGGGQLEWKRTPRGKFQTSGELRVEQFALAAGGRAPWREEQLTLAFSAEGTRTTKLEQLTQAEVSLVSGADRAVATLAQAVREPGPGGLWPVKVEVQGDLATWQSRLSPWLPLVGWQAVGRLELKAEGSGSPEELHLASFDLTVDELAIEGPRFAWEEPRLLLNGQADLVRSTGQLEIKQAVCQSRLLGARLADVMWAGGESPRFAGQAVFEADLGLLSQAWRSDLFQTWQLAGICTGKMGLEAAGAKTQATFDAKCTQFSLGAATGQTWTERELSLALSAMHDREADRLLLSSLELSGEQVALLAQGGITSLSSVREVELAGTLDYDLAALAPLLEPYTGEHVVLEGRDKGEFHLAGPLAPTEGDVLASLGGAMQLGWERADLFGFAVGPAATRAELAQGVVTFEPLKAAVNGGRLSVTPTLHLVPQPRELVLAPGMLAERVALTPALCDRALKYIAPALAQATQLEGEISLELEGARVPLAAPLTGEAAGKLTVHRVEINTPSPLLQVLAALTRQQLPVTLKRESSLPFRVVDGRVYHQGLELEFPQVTIRTYGSVGLDQSLALIAEMPFPASLLTDDRLREALGKRIVKVPIGGTLDRPRVDRRALDKLLAEFVEESVGDALRGEVDRQLDRLLRPR